MGVTLLDITVGTKDFRQALQAVLPHAHTKPDEWPELARLRCHVDRQNLMVSATDRYTAAIGLCSVWSDDLGAAADIGVFDLALDQAKKILAVFKLAAVYGEPLLMTSMGSTGLAPMLVRCGDSFLGCVTPRRFDEDQALKHKEWLQDWIHRLPPPAAEVDLNPTRDTSEERTDDAADD